MYFVKYGDTYIHDPRVGMILPSATLETEINKSDNFYFEIPITHECCKLLKERDREKFITVWADDKIIFRGEVTSVKQNFYLTKTVECRGELSYLNDTIVRPYSTLADEASRKAPDTVNGFFDFLIGEHNSQVQDDKKFSIGKNYGSVLATNNYIYYSDSSYPTVGDTIKDVIIDNLGGNIELEYLTDGTRRISLLDSFQKKNAQIIDFGENLLDYAKNIDALDVVTFVVPIGETMDDSSDTSSDKLKEGINISDSVVSYFESEATYYYGLLVEALEEQSSLDPDASEEEIQRAQEKVDAAQSDYDIAIDKYSDALTYTTNRALGDGYYKYRDMIYSDKAVKRYGWIGKSITYSDISYVSYLLAYGLNDLKKLVESTTTIEIKAIDLSMIKSDYEPIRIGQYVRVRSKPHDFDSYMLCSKITYDISKPDNNTFTLGTVYQTLTGQQNKKINELNKTINAVLEKIK